MKKIIALTPGCEHGVGPELIIKAAFLEGCLRVDFLWCGDLSSLKLACERARLSLTSFADHRALINDHVEISYASELITGDYLQRQAQFLQIAVDLAQKKLINALVTGPINKASLLHLEGKPAGQTEFFNTIAMNGMRPMMSFLGGPFMLSLLTSHIPLSHVADHLHSTLVREHLCAVAVHAARLLQKTISEVSVCVLGLNPHAGEGGLLGHEENEIITPAIISAQKLGINVVGPYAADGFFAYFHENFQHRFDVVVAVYHDQGLIPYKLLAQGIAVNATFGLTIPRTSPAHGTAVDLTGKNIACIKSTAMAVTTAIKLATIYGRNEILQPSFAA